MTNNSEVSVTGRHVQKHVPRWHSRGGLLLFGSLAIAAIMSFTGHRAHVLEAAPFLFLLACPLMHIFIHHGQGGHDGVNNDGGRT